jgi:glucokinase
LTVDYGIGIDLGGSSIKTLAVTAEGDALAKEIVEFDPEWQMDWANKVLLMLDELQTRQHHPASCIGVSAPGLAAADRRSILCMPGRLQGLAGLNWTTFLGAKKSVPVLNDAHAALMGEAWLGAAQEFKDVFMLTLGTGVGGAAMIDGKLLHGHIGRGGHLGHISLDPHGPPDVTGMPGSLEMTIGNCTIETRTHGRFKNTHDLVAAAEGGDTEAAAIWLKSVHHLACGIGSLINVLDPEAAIIGGGIARAGATLFEPLQKALDEVEWRPTGSRVKLLPAKLCEFAGAYGAAFMALNAPI